VTPRRAASPAIDGILLVDKPAGMTSAAVVREVKRRLGVDKVGHLGTLDPFATGLLPLCLGEGAKVVPFLNQEAKAYSGTIVLGRETDTLDATGAVVAENAVPPLDDDRLADAAKLFVGTIEQVPPMYSAIKKDGVPLYRLARQGVELHLEPRRVTITSLEVGRGATPERLSLRVHCSKGTYVRSLARDLARALGTVGLLESLRREEFGPFRVADAVALDELAVGVPSGLLSPREAIRHVPETEVPEALAVRLRRGQQWPLRGFAAPGTGELRKVVSADGLVAVIGEHGGEWQLLRVFAAGGNS
jgi:tRNA pseudouridine55 synthase